MTPERPHQNENEDGLQGPVLEMGEKDMGRIKTLEEQTQENITYGHSEEGRE